MTARNGLSFSAITLRRVALVVIVNPRLKRLVTCVCRAAAAPAHRIFGLFVAFTGRFIHGNEVSPGNLCREPAAVA